MVLLLVRCDRAVDYEGSSLSDYGRMCFKLKPSELYILSCGNGLGFWPRRFPQIRM